MTMSGFAGTKLIDIEVQLANELLKLEYPDAKYVYNPLSYAIKPHSEFIEKYCNESPKKILFLGMNPGPWGMAQTGVPFGEISSVKEWLHIMDDEVKAPEKEHPKKKVEGFSCSRREVSGERFWKFMENQAKFPSIFFRNCIVYNHCPLLFLSESGKNLTPPDFKASVRDRLVSLCDDALMNVIELYQIEHVVGIGRYAEKRAKKVLIKNERNSIRVHFLTHPSPASAKANKGWDALAYKALDDSNLLTFINGDQ